MSSVLYRKYRPLSFSELRGQETIKDILLFSITNNSFSHGYLFSGPRGTGKTTTARLFARAINDPNFNKKSDLSSYIEGSIDIIEMDAASNRGIDEIRELRESIQFLPAELRFKVYIIDEAHMLTKEAFNALLKTLEEPPSHVVFILATTEPHKIPVTILSRVTRLDFKLATESELVNKVKLIADREELDIDKKALKQVFKLSGGSFRDAESILAKLIHSGSKKIDIITVKNIFGLLTEQEYLEILGLINQKDFKLLEKFIKNIDDSNIQYLVEGLLEYIIDNNTSTELIPLILDIVKNLRYFKDKKMYMLAKFMYLNNLPSSLAKTEISLDNTLDVNEVFNNVCVSLENDNKRLGAVLKTCKIKEYKDKELILENKFRFNIRYLSQKDNLDLIKKLLNQHLEVLSIEFAYNMKEKEELSKEKVSIFKPSLEPVEKPESTLNNDFDNSELIESIL